MIMTVKDLQIDSPVYRVQLDSIGVAHVRLIEAFNDGTRRIELTYGGQRCVEKCVEKMDASEIKTESQYSVYPTLWYLNIDEAKTAQLIMRSEQIEEAKKYMEKAQKGYTDMIEKYAFAEPSIPKEI